MAAFFSTWARKVWNAATLLAALASITLPVLLIVVGAFVYEPLIPYATSGLVVTLLASARPKALLSLIRRANGDLASAPPLDELNKRLGKFLENIQIELSRQGHFFVHGSLILTYTETLPGTEPIPRARLSLRGRNGDAPTVDLKGLPSPAISAIEQSLLPEVRRAAARRRALFRQIDKSKDVVSGVLDLSALSQHDLLKRSAAAPVADPQARSLAKRVEASLSY